MAHGTWSGLTLEQDQIWESLWDKYVPSTGMAETVGGEILRAMSRIIYRFFNDGDMVGVGYGNETCNSSDRYLCEMIPKCYVTLDQFCESQETAYENQMLRNHRVVFAYLQNNPQVFEITNTIDSRETDEDDYRRSREYDGYEEEDEWDECCDEPIYDEED